MPSLRATELGDLVASTLRDFGEPNYTDLASDLTAHVVAEALMKPASMEKFSGGYGLQWNVMVDTSQSASNVGLYQRYTVNQRDTMIQAQVDWAHSHYHWAVERRELAMNRSPRQIVRLLNQRRVAANAAWVELMERNFWAAPDSDDDTTPLGLPYWVTKNATTGFNGGILSGYTSVANVSPTTYDRWNNWTFQYTDIDDVDFIAKAREAATKTNFKPVVKNIPQHGDSSPKRAYYTNYTVIQALENHARSQNENLGKDVAAMDGETLFRRMPVHYVPLLNDDTTDPFYGIDWSVFKIGYLAGEWDVEEHFPSNPDQPTVAVTHKDSTYQYFCYNRRKCFVGATGTSYPL